MVCFLSCLEEKQGIKCLFGNVTAGEVHPQPYIISFGKKKKCFPLVEPTKIQDETTSFGEAALAASRGAGCCTVEHGSIVQ